MEGVRFSNVSTDVAPAIFRVITPDDHNTAAGLKT
jgi:hypothetical protein